MRNIKDIGFLNHLLGKGTAHVEALSITEKKFTKHLEKYHSKCYCLCPENYEYVRFTFGTKLSKKEYYEFLKEKYLLFKKMGCDLQLHVHLVRYPQTLSNNEKEKLILESYNFFKKELSITPKEIVFGWYISDDFSEGIAKKLGLKIIKRHFHIYDFWLKD